LAILVGSRLWPYFDYWTLLFQGSVEPWYRSPLFKGFVIAIGPALFGAPILIRYALKRQNLFVFWGAVFCGAIYFASLAGKVLIGGRFLFFTGFFLQVAIALYVVEHRLFRWKSMRESLQAQGFAFLIAFMLLIPALLFRTMEFGRKKPLRVTESAAPVHPFLFLRGHLHPGDIVMGADKTVWTIPALTGAKVVVPQKANPLIIEDTARRLADTRRFLYSPLSTVDRQALLHQYGATHILVDEVADADADSTLWRDVDVLSRLEAWRGHLKLYRVVPS